MTDQPFWITLALPHIPDRREALAAALESGLTASGAVKYDPFGLMPGLAYPRAVKLFIAPEGGTWLRMIPAPDCDLALIVKAASKLDVLLVGIIDAALTPSLIIYRDGQPVDTLPALTPYLSDPERFADLLSHPQTGSSGGVGGVSGGALPSDVRAMSNGQSSRMAERMMNSMTGGISKSDKAGAQSMLSGVDWDSGAGGWMRAVLSHLRLDDAVQPDYGTVSTAYRTARRLARNPSATLYPGDADARAVVPDALDYLPVYYGWKAAS